MGREIGRSLERDRKRRTEEAGAAVEELMKADPPLTQEAWHRLQGWYKATVDRPPTTRSSYAQAGNGGADNTVQPGTPPGRHHPDHNHTFYSGGWRPLGGGSGLSGKTPVKQLRRGAVKDAGGGPERVVGGSEEGGERRGSIET